MHNYKRWRDVVTGLGLAPDMTALVVNRQHYRDGGRDYMREKQLVNCGVTSPVAMNVEVRYTVAEGNNLQANIIVG